MQPAGDYLNMSQAARELDVSYSTVKGLIHRREIGYERIARSVRIRRADLEEYRGSCYVPALPHLANGKKSRARDRARARQRAADAI